MAFWFNIFPDFRDYTIFINQKCGPFNTHILAAIHAFLGPDIIGFKRCFALIRDQGDLQVIFGAELLMTFDGVR